MVKNWFTAKKIKVLNLLSQSPDLTPIKHLWEHIGKKKSEDMEAFFKGRTPSESSIGIRVVKNPARVGFIKKPGFFGQNGENGILKKSKHSSNVLIDQLIIRASWMSYLIVLSYFICK